MAAKHIALILAAYLASALPAQANPPHPLTWQNYRTRLQTGLDTQPGVINTTGCAWNDQDDIADRGTGDINANTPATHSLCIIADFDDTSRISGSIYPKAALYEFWTSRPDTEITLSNDAGDSWPTPVPVKDGGDYRYQLCVLDPVADRHNSDLSSYSEIPGTNGGRGQRVNYTLTIQTARDLHATVGYLEVAPSGPQEFALRLLDVPCPPVDGQ